MGKLPVHAVPPEMSWMFRPLCRQELGPASDSTRDWGNGMALLYHTAYTFRDKLGKHPNAMCGDIFTL